MHVIGLGSDRLPANVRVADLLAPPRIFPGDSFSITGYLQSQGLEGEIAQVELLEAEVGSYDRCVFYEEPDWSCYRHN